MDDERPTNTVPVGMTGRGLRRRRLARFMFVPAIVPAIMTGALFMMAPNTMGGGMWVEPPDPTLPTIVIGGGILGYLFGLAVMIRIYRADPEAGPSPWRFREF